MSEDTTVIDTPVAEMWTLSPDRVQLDVPPVAIAGLSDPVRIRLDFDADSVGEILRRLIVLRSRMPEAE
jgi:hypothetical protein